MIGFYDKIRTLLISVFSCLFVDLLDMVDSNSNLLITGGQLTVLLLTVIYLFFKIRNEKNKGNES